MNTEAIGACPHPTNALRGVAAMGYAAHHEYLDRKLRRGAKSAYCVTCSRWRFREERCSAFAADDVRGDS